jgi:hypothetical protein
MTNVGNMCVVDFSSPLLIPMHGDKVQRPDTVKPRGVIRFNLYSQ